MTILELEQLTGLERSAIRYYEKKGLLVAARQENSYRDYSIENANEILRSNFCGSWIFPSNRFCVCSRAAPL